MRIAERFKVRHKLVADKPGRQVSQLGHGLVMEAPFAGNINRPDRTDLAQVFEALAGRALAELEPLDQVIHGQRAIGNEQKAVNLRQGPGLAEQPGKLDEEVNDLRFQWAELRGRPGRPRIGTRLFFFDRQHDDGEVIAHGIVCSIQFEHLKP